MTRRNSALLFFVFLTSIVSAQNMNDEGIWNTFSFSGDIKDLTPWKDPKIFKDWSLHINPEIRFNENVSQMSNVFSDFGTDKKWSKYLTPSLVGTKRLHGLHKSYLVERKITQLLLVNLVVEKPQSLRG